MAIRNADRMSDYALKCQRYLAVLKDGCTSKSERQKYSLMVAQAIEIRKTAMRWKCNLITSKIKENDRNQRTEQ